MKKILIILLVVLMTGCGTKKTEPKKEEKKEIKNYITEEQANKFETNLDFQKKDNETTTFILSYQNNSSVKIKVDSVTFSLEQDGKVINEITKDIKKEIVSGKKETFTYDIKVSYDDVMSNKILAKCTSIFG